MDKKRLKVALKVLGAVKEHFPDTKNFMEELTGKQCQKESLEAKS